MPDTEPAGFDWQKALTVVIDVACVGYLIWMLCPGLRVHILGQINQAREERRARAEWERISRQLAYETYEVRSAMEGGTDGLAARLDIAG